MAPLDGIEAVVLAGGKGRRMAARFPGVQKVCQPVGGRPFFHHVVAQLARHGCRRVILAAGHLAEQVEAAAAAVASETGVAIAVTRESVPGGTGGAVALAAALTRSDPVLVANGDSLAKVDFDRFVATHRRTDARATIAVTPVADAARFGRVEFDPDGRITGFSEKAPPAPGAAHVSCGVYLLSRAALNDVATAFGRANGALSLERDVFPSWIGVDFRAFAADGPFIDIGVPEGYDAAVADAVPHERGKAP